MIPVIHHGKKSRYQQVYEFYREAILSQKLHANEKLPSYRWLAAELGVANNTIIQAYEQLVAEGYVRNEQRRGLFVNKIAIRDWQLHSMTEATAIPAESKRKKKIPFSASVHLVDQGNFPVKQWRKCSNWALDNISFQYEEYENDESLKEQLVKYLYKYRGVKTTSAQLIIGSGASSLMFWLAFVLRKQCRRMLMEDPGYARIKNLFLEFDYQVKPITVQDNGIDIMALKKTKADLLYLTPSHQYPTGAAIPVNHRLQILDWAKRNNAFIIEDDFDCEFRYKTKLMPSLQALDGANNVIYVGTFSSALMPSLRVAYIVIPPQLLTEIQSFKHLTNTVPFFTRKTLALFMEHGYWESHLRKMGKVYRLKYEACIAKLKTLPKQRIRFNDTPSGLNIFLKIFTTISESEVVRRAADQGILVTPGSQFYHVRQKLKHVEILFEFGSIPTDEIEHVIQKLYKACFP
ncbi:MocR-like pyridoxine biosynthesis transcription factor PdxR [Pseudochryseolinea flava]|uniref:PLP-dependent aminotransferase family protein n=1 Tax=Pseudochryseolinea flava TaxID=2059302 RepID=A0A364Y5N3_9BACT|nr:PLP-dependent aminotransferase family protein [Pseudochryseolinea flava]RAW02263.1 PLP-dependent aminotransferase family protein [Pseudochryseolinea flava]